MIDYQIEVISIPPIFLTCKGEATTGFFYVLSFIFESPSLKESVELLYIRLNSDDSPLGIW